MRLVFFLSLFFYVSLAQEYSPNRYHNPENKIKTKDKDNNRLKDLFNSVLLKRSKVKDDCNCDDKSPVKAKFSFKYSISRTFVNIVSCKKPEFGKLAFHINFPEYYYTWSGIYDYDPWQLSDLSIGAQLFNENTTFDLWLSAPIFNEDVQRYGLRGGISFFPIGHRGVIRPYLGTSLGLEVKYTYENIFQNNILANNWYSEYYLLGRLHAGIQYMFRCNLIYKFDVSYAAGSYIDRDSNQFPHYRPWVIFQSFGVRF
jgi:hypothetical protein